MCHLRIHIYKVTFEEHSRLSVQLRVQLRNHHHFFFFFITLGLELSDTKVYEPYIRALLGTASRSCGAVVLESGTVPFGTALG